MGVILSDFHDHFQTAHRESDKGRYFGCREPKAGLPAMPRPGGEKRPAQTPGALTAGLDLGGAS